MRPRVALLNLLNAQQVLAGWGDVLKSRDLLQIAALATVSVLALWPQASSAQSSSSPPQTGAQPLPPVVVAAPEARRRATSPEQRRTRRATQAAQSSKPPPKREATTVVESPRDAIHGYVAGRFDDWPQ